MYRAILLGIISLLLFSFEAGAATWYVRPASGEYGAEDGTSYATAFDGPEDITWGVGGVSAGDTLIFCGAFSAGAGGTYWITVGASGSAGLPIRITGDCSSQGDLSMSKWDGGNVRVVALTTNTQTYIDIENIEVYDFTTRGLYLTNITTPDQTISRNINVDAVYVHDIDGNAGASPTCISVIGRDVSITDSRIVNCGDDNIAVQGKRFTSSRNYISGSGIDTSTGDCISLGGASVEIDGFSVENTICDHTHEDEKQCFVATLSSDAPAGQFVGNTCAMPPNATVMFGITVDSGNIQILRNHITGGLVGLSVGNTAGQTVTVAGNILTGQTQDGIRTDFSLANQTTVIYNNVIFGSGRYGINADCNHATCATPAYNNVVIGARSACLRTLNTPFVHKNNAVNSCAANYFVNTTPTTPDASTIIADPALLGGTSPTTADGFKLKSNSPLCGAGTPTDAKYDYEGYRFGIPPNIGAFATCERNDTFTNRTIFTNRTTYVNR